MLCRNCCSVDGLITRWQVYELFAHRAELCSVGENTKEEQLACSDLSQALTAALL